MSKLSDVQIQEIQVALNDFCEEDPTSRTGKLIANNVGVSPATIHLFRKNTYTGNNETVALKVQNFLDLQKQSAVNALKEPVFSMTTVSEDIFKTAKYALAYRKIAVIVGEPGCGKTVSVKEFHKRNRTSILIEVDDTITTRSLLKLISKALRLREDGSLNDQLIEIVNSLKGTNRLLIIDEAENLSTKELETIRRIQDFAKIGLLLSGTKRLASKLRGRRGELAQLYSRIGMKTEVGTLTINDTKQILEGNYPRAARYFTVFHELCKRNGRHLEHLIDLVKFATTDGGIKISEELIDEAADLLLTK